MAWYPFDTQRCRIVVTPVAGDFINIKPGVLRYLGPEDLTQYFIKNSQITNATGSDDTQMVYVEVTLGRRLLGTMLTVYLPTILLNVIGFATNFFKVRNKPLYSN